MDGTDNHGPNGPDNPVRGRDDRIESRMDVCSGDMFDGAGPAYRGGDRLGRGGRLSLRLGRGTTDSPPPPDPNCKVGSATEATSMATA